jgi:hypothetical protein
MIGLLSLMVVLLSILGMLTFMMLVVLIPDELLERLEKGL